MDSLDSQGALELRARAAGVARKLARAGHEALFAGGCVRDRLLGLPPAEYDIATSATPEEIRAVFPRAVGVGEAFGVMLVREGGTTFEVATFRSDGGYADGRRPSEVRFTDAVADAQRRDFTINGLFEAPQTGAVIDHVGGVADLERRVLRAIGDPQQRLAEDRLRAVRAVRFAATLDLTVDPGTDAAITGLAGNLAGISCERFGQELRRILPHPSRANAIGLIERWSLDLPMLGSHRRGTRDRVARLEAKSRTETVLAAWLLDRDAGASTRASDLAADLQPRLGLSNAERDGVADTLRIHGELESRWNGLTVAGKRRLAMEPAFEGALAILAGSSADLERAIRSDLAGFGPDRSPPRWVRGHVLLEAGMPPGPGLGRVLEAIYDAQLEGRVASPEEAIALAHRLMAHETGNPGRADGDS